MRNFLPKWKKKKKNNQQVRNPLWMETLCSYSLIIVSVYAGLFEVHESYSNQLWHPSCFPVWTIFLKVGCLSAWKYYLFSKYFHPKPAAVLSKWLAEFRWVSVYVTPIHKTDLALYKNAPYHQIWVNVWANTVALHSQVLNLEKLALSWTTLLSHASI